MYLWFMKTQAVKKKTEVPACDESFDLNIYKLSLHYKLKRVLHMPNIGQDRCK